MADKKKAESIVQTGFTALLAFFREYPDPAAIVQQAVAQLPLPAKVPQPAAQMPDSLLWLIPWFHHVTVEEIETRLGEEAGT